jgi:S1-C subfamily serine protease
MSAPAISSLLQEYSSALAGLVASTAPSLVSIESQSGTASGFVWKPGLIITPDETLAEDGEISVIRAGGERLPARLVGRDPTTDIALLRVERADLTPANLTHEATSIGALAVALGCVDGEPVAALALVSRVAGAWRSMRGGEIDARIEVDARVRRSAEGGLLLAASGGALGMLVFGPRRRVLLIPSSTIARVATKLEQHGRVSRGYLGLGLQSVALQGGEGWGAMVMSVDAKGPAATAGLYQGDVITAWNGAPVRDVQSLIRMLGPDSVGKSVTLRVQRAAETREAIVVVAERPDR